VSKVGGRRNDAGAWLPAQTPAELRAGVEANLVTLDTEQIGAVNLRRTGARTRTACFPKTTGQCWTAASSWGSRSCRFPLGSAFPGLPKVTRDLEENLAVRDVVLSEADLAQLNDC